MYEESPFANFMRLSDWLWQTTRQTHGIALMRLFELLLKYAKEHHPDAIDQFAHELWKDYRREGRTDKPSFLAEFELIEESKERVIARVGSERQSRHRVG